MSDTKDSAVRAEELVAAATTKRRRRRKKAPPQSAAVLDAMPAEPKRRGLLTRGVLASLGGLDAGVEGARSAGRGSWIAVAALLVVAAFTALSWSRAPRPPAVVGIHFADGVRVPDLLLERWLREFHDVDALVAEGRRASLDAFADHLRSRAEVAAVDHVRIAWLPLGDRLRRQVDVALRLRRPLMPLMLASGERAWVDADGVVLPGILAGPRGEPVLRGLEHGGVEALREVLELWPRLRAALPPDLVTDIRLDHPLGERDQGIAFLTRPGTVLIWGRADERRYGLSPDEKIRNLVHTLNSHGDLRRVGAINVRFPEPFAVLADAEAALGG